VITSVVNPQEIFFNPKRLIVPLFQRPYVWSKESQWEPLWHDIVRLIDVIARHNQNATHFLGAIVIQQAQTALGSLPAWHIIDGQQRLTTLQLLLDALHSELERRSLTNRAGQILPLVENPAANCETPDDRFKVWPTNRDRDGFASVMFAPSPVDYSLVEKSRLCDAHRFFAESISEWLDNGEGGDLEQKAKTLVAVVSTRIEIVSINLDPNEDAQEIFETLNARGTPLSAADLIKNFVFQQIPWHDAESAYSQYWAQFETPWWEAEITSGRVKNTRASLFLSQWLTARTLQDFPVREVFTQFKYYVNTVAKDPILLLREISCAATRYRAIIEGSSRPDGILSRSELFSYRVGTLDSEVVRPILIWLDEPEQSSIPSHYRDRILDILESWFVRRSLVKASSQGINRFLIDLLKYLSTQPAESLPDAVEAFLVSNHSPVGYWPGDDEVRSALTDSPAYWKYLRARLRMVLEALEDSRRGYPNGSQLAMGPITRLRGSVEHIMPQEWRTNWDTGLSPKDAVTRDRILQELGNLTLVTQALNSKVSNGSWPTKREYFQLVSDVLITNEAVHLGGDSWDETTIQQRTAMLVSQILSIWPAPAGHVGLVAGSAGVPSTVSVDIAQLVASDWLQVGTVLKPTYKAAGMSNPDVQAIVAQDGRIYIDSHAYDTPSGAGRAVNNGRSINGWWFWAIADSGKRLYDLRNEYLESIGRADSEVIDDAPGATEGALDQEPHAAG